MIEILGDIWLVPLGVAAGILGSMIGLGGGIIVVPVLTFLGFPHTLAASNSLFAAFSNSVASVFSYSRQKRIDYDTGLKLGLLSVPGTVLGALVSVEVTPEIFKIMFAMLLIASGVYIFLRKSIRPKVKVLNHAMMILIIAASFFAGIVSSLFGVGGGTIFVPLMAVIMAMTVKRAAPTSQFILFFASLSGIIAHSLLGHPDFLQSAYLAIGAFIGGMIGARLSLEISERYLRIMISAVIFVAALGLILDPILS